LLRGWQLCPVLRLLLAKDGSVTTEIKITIESPDSRTGHKEEPITLPLLEAQNRADAAAPGALQGAEIFKKFENGLWYKGKVGAYDSKHGWYRVTYDDGDSEEMEGEEILELLFKTMPSWDFCPPWQLDINATTMPLPVPNTALTGRVAIVGRAPVEKAQRKKMAGRQKRQKITVSAEISAEIEKEEGEYSDGYATDSEGYQEESEDEEFEDEEEEMEVESPRKEASKALLLKTAQPKSSSNNKIRRKTANTSYSIVDIFYPNSNNTNPGLSRLHPSRTAAASPVISPPKAPHNFPLAGGGAAAVAAAAVAAGNRAVRVHSPPLAPSTAPIEEDADLEAGSLPEDIITTADGAVNTGGGVGGSSLGERTAAAAAIARPQAETTLPRPVASGSTSGMYAPCGAGHQRGTLAYDRLNKTFRPIGKWIVDKKAGTLLGRFIIDRRYLDVQEGIGPNKRSEAAPGWIGVRGTLHTNEEEDEDGEEDEDEDNGNDGDGGSGCGNNITKKKVPQKSNKSTVLGAPYTIIYYEPSHAKQCHLLYPTFNTAEEAAKAYDEFALNYYDPSEVDLNYPLDPTTRAALAERYQSEYANLSGRRAAILCAVDILNFEQSIPYQAVAQGSATPDDWEKFEYVLIKHIILA
jgi:hypothetical protein